MARNQLILDTDGGVDDAQALVLLIANGRPPDLITTVFGNVGLDVATSNMLATLATLGSAIPVYTGADRPLTQPIIDARYVHGEDGLGGAPRPSHTAAIASADAIGLLRQSFRDAAASGQKIDILMIGPLTNLALALRLEPGILAGIGQLTIMGGTVYGRGNITPAAEFNIYADPEAASIVFSAEIDTVVAPWEPCFAHFIDGAQTDAIFAAAPASPDKSFSEALASHARRNSVARGAGDVMRFVDPLAAAIVIDPTIVTKSLVASIGVALAPGITRGMTLVDPSGRMGTPKHQLIETVDIDKMIELYAVSAAYKS